MRAKERLLPAAGLAISVALVWAITFGIVWNAADPQLLEDEKHATAERLLFYALGPGESVRLNLPAGAEEVRLATHLLLPAGARYAPERQYLYGLDVRLLSGGAEAAVPRSLYTRTRQSKADLRAGTWLREAAFLARPGAEVTDERELVVAVPQGSRGSSGTLVLRHPGREGTLLVRAFARFDRSPSVFLRTKRDSLERAEGRVERATFVPWERLSLETQRRILEERWERLGAEGEAGRDYRVEVVYRTGFRLLWVQVADAANERLGPGAAVAVNAVGPARLTLWLWVQQPAAEKSSPLSLRIFSAEGTETVTPLPVPAGEEPLRTEVEVPAGLHTLSLHNPGPTEVRYALEGPASAQLALPALEGAQGASRTALLPDWRRSAAYFSGPSCAPLELELDGSVREERILRVDARVLRATEPGGGAPTEVNLEFRDRAGAPLGRASVSPEPETAPFDLVERVPGAAEVPCAAAPVPAPPLEVSDLRLLVSSAVSGRVQLPKGTRLVRLSSTRPAALQAFEIVYRGSATPEPPYQEPLPEATRWVGAPLLRRNWYPLRPRNHELLRAQGAEATLITQVHLEPAPEGAEPPSGDAVVLVPAGLPRSMEIFEPQLEPEPDPEAQVHTALQPNRPVRLRFEARSPARPEIRFDLGDASALGSRYEVWVDGKRALRSVLSATRSRELLWPLPPGEHEVELRAERPLCAAFNRPPAADGEALRIRTLYQLEGRPLRVAVRRRGATAVIVNIVVYTPATDASAGPRVAITIDGGDPQRREAVFVPTLTTAVMAAALPKSDRPPAFPLADPLVRWHPHRIAVTLGADLAPGLHWVRVDALGSGPAWARFFAYDRKEAESPREWNRPGWDGEDRP